VPGERKKADSCIASADFNPCPLKRLVRQLAI
jgi:hypothetical protein